MSDLFNFKHSFVFLDDRRGAFLLFLSFSKEWVYVKVNVSASTEVSIFWIPGVVKSFVDLLK